MNNKKVNKEKGSRNKAKTKQKILDATDRIILRDGFRAVGINAVAREAGVDKVMIYRYFGDLVGLLKAFAIEKDYWLGIFDENQADPKKLGLDDLRIFSIRLMTDLLKNIIENKEMQELLLWELTDTNEISKKTNSLREEKGIKVMSTLYNAMQTENVDLAALSTVIVSAIYFLVLRSKTVDIFNSVPLNTPEGWKRIEGAIEFLCDAIFKELLAKSKKFK